VRLPSTEIIFKMCFFVFLGSHSTIYGPPKLAKRRFLGKFRSHSTIHKFKNFFVTVFSVISFQFLAINGIQKDSKKKKKWS